MPFIIVSSGGQELNRLELRRPLVVGRGPDCDICVHDIMLSRRHCRLTPTADGWLLIDLASRNGTHLSGRNVEQRRLVDGDVITLGKTRLTYRTARFIPPPPRPHRPAIPPMIDPANMTDTAAETAFGAVYTEPKSPSSSDRILRPPTPRPRPRDPDSFASDDVYSMLEQIASSSWDSIYAVNAQPLRRKRPTPRPLPNQMALTNRPPPKSSLSLQALPTAVRLPSAAPTVTVHLKTPNSKARRSVILVADWLLKVRHLRVF